jgi:serine/threonine protein kinase
MERKEIKSFLHQMLLGIADCHVKMVIHRDLKPENILLDEESTLGFM